jgi:hypothetical protein
VAKAIHFVCAYEGTLPRNMVKVEGQPGVYDSGFWDISEEEAAQLKDGWIFLHERKAKPSYAGGWILGIRFVERPEFSRSKRCVITFEMAQAGRNVPWSGKGFENGGVVERPG